MRTKYRWDKELAKLLPINEWYERNGTQKRMHAIHEDTAEIESTITGEVFTSKSKYLRHVKDHGYEVHGDAWIDDHKPRPEWHKELTGEWF